MRAVQRVVTAAFTSAIPKNAPGEIVYIPVGSNEITPSVNGKPQKITVNVPVAKGAAIAASLNAALAKRLEDPVRPRLAFDHSKSGPASGHPKAFSFDPALGIVLALDWSTSGRAAVEGGDYGYFSPTFLIDDNGVPDGLPDKGEIGSLVDEPAFRKIGLIAASDQDLTPENINTMSKLILAALGIDDSRADAESIAIKRISAMQGDADKLTLAEKKAKDLEEENGTLKKKAEASDKIIADQAEKRADDLVKAAALDGRILPKDDKTQGFYKRLIAAGDADAEESLKGLPKLNAGLDKPVIIAADGTRTVAGEHAFETKAKQLVTAKEASTFDEALSIVAAREPVLYTEYCKTIR
jgi:phage I-like protein